MIANSLFQFDENNDSHLENFSQIPAHAAFHQYFILNSKTRVKLRFFHPVVYAFWVGEQEFFQKKQ